MTAIPSTPLSFLDAGRVLLEVSPSTPLPVTDFLMELRRGNVPGASVTHKFGSQVDIAATYSPVTTNALYQTPQVSGATALRIKAGNANDTAAGSGAREITLQGLNENGVKVEEKLATAGASASAVTSTTWIRLFRFWVSASGTYASPTAGSHAAAIVIETAGGTEWGQIAVAGVPISQSQVAIYSTPLGVTTFVASYQLTTDGNKPVDFVLFNRQKILQTAVPYEARRVVSDLYGVEGHLTFVPVTPLGPFPESTDIGWLARGASTPDVTADYEMIHFDNDEIIGRLPVASNLGRILKA